MKLSELSLKYDCVAGYNATMQSPAMQAVLANAIAADEARIAAQAARIQKIRELHWELSNREKAGETNLDINYYTLTVEAK